MKRLSIALYIFAAIFTFSSITLAQKKPQAPAKKKAASPARPKAAQKQPTRLPPKKKKTTVIDFEKNSGTHTTTVIVRTPLPLEEAQDEKSLAEKQLKETQKKMAEKPKPIAPALPPPPPPPRERHLIPVAPVPPPETPLPVATDDSSTPPPEPAPVVESFTIPETTSHVVVMAPEAPRAEKTSALLRTSYIGSKYSEIAPELENGQTTLALGLESPLRNNLHGRALIELGHGMDQSVTIQNTRSFILRADLIYLLDLKSNFVQALFGGGLGFLDANVRSYRTNGAGGTTLREHEHVSSLLGVPFTGMRFSHDDITVDLTIEYTAVLSAKSSTFGGLTGALTLGFKF